MFKVRDDIKDEKIKKTMEYCLEEGAAYSVSVGAGNNFITPYAIKFNATNMQISLLSSIPNIVNSILQMFTPKLMEKHDRKKIVVTSVFIQASLWIPIIMLYFAKDYAPYLLIFLVTLYTMMNSLISPAWRSWISDIIPEKIRGKFFGQRNRLMIVVQIISMILVGFLLDKTKSFNVFVGFAIAFFMAFLGRMTSGYLLTKHYEPKFVMSKKKYFSFFQFIRKAPKNNFGRFALFIGLITASVYIAAPFFAVYMLRNLSFSYTVYTIVNIFSYVGLALGMGFWGKISDEIGNKKVLEISSYFISTYPFWWLISGNPIFLSIINLMSGFFWAGFNLSSFNYIFDAVSRERRGICAAYTNSLTGIGIFIGSFVGGILSEKINADFNVILIIFAISGVMRLATTAVFMRKIREVRLHVKPLSFSYFIRKNL